MGSATDIDQTEEDIDQGSTDLKILHAPVLHWSCLNRFPISTTERNDSMVVVYSSSPSSVLSIPDQGSFSSGVFHLLDTVRSPETELRQNICWLRFLSSLPYGRDLADRLDFLLEAVIDEGEQWQDCSGASLRHMLQFLEAVPNFRAPQITITPAATFRAQWTRDETAHLAVDFLADGMVRFVVFRPDPRRKGKVHRMSGISSWDGLIEVVDTLNVSRWAENAGR